MARSSETIVLDKGTQFTSAHHKVFNKNHAIEHVPSPSYQTQSNGQAGDVWREGLLRRLLNTDRMSIHSRLSGKSPAEVLMWRTVWTTNNAMLPRPVSSKPEQLLKRVTFNVGDLSYLAISGLVKPGPPPLLLDDLGFSIWNSSKQLNMDPTQEAVKKRIRDICVEDHAFQY